MSIPKIIHYCWFGKNKKNKKILDMIKTWNLLYDYEIIEWNEENFDINCCPYVSEAYRLKKWAFVSDYVRLKVLNEYGGIYLDTDVEIKKSFDNLLNDEMFLGFIFDSSVGTAVIGSKANNIILKNLIEIYENASISIIDNKIKHNFPVKYADKVVNNNDLITGYLIENYDNFQLNNKEQRLHDFTIYPKEYFEKHTYNKKIDYAVHHCDGSWWRIKEKNLILVFIKIIIGNVIYDYITCKMKNSKLPFYNYRFKDKE